MSTWESSPQPDPVAEHPPPSVAPAASDTGDAHRNDSAGGDELTRLAEIPLADHPAIFERIHADLRAALADIHSA